MRPSSRCSPHAEHVVDRPDVEAPRGVELTGTNGRKATSHPSPWEGAVRTIRQTAGRQGALFRSDTAIKHETTRPLAGSQTTDGNLPREGIREDLRRPWPG